MPHKTAPLSLAWILTETYGVSPLAASPTCVIWAATELAKKVGAEKAKRQLKALDRQRAKVGKIPAYADYGTLLF